MGTKYSQATVYAVATLLIVGVTTHDYSRDTCISTAKYGYKEWQYVISHDGVGQDAFKDRG